MMGWHDGGGYGWLGWLFMSLFLVAFWSVLIYGVLAIFRSTRRDGAPQQPGQPAPGDARRLLDEQFARGEIDEQDYTHRREVLRSSQ